MPSVRARIAAATLLVLAGAAPAAAELYEWVDEEGTVHYAADLDRVPERFRAAVRTVATPTPLPAPPPGAAVASGPAASGTARIPYVPGQPILVQARINGAGPVTLVLDTGADRTLIDPATLRALGVAVGTGARVALRGVTGSADVEVVEVALVEVGAARVGPLPVVAHDAGVSGAHGLLGRDFLERFRVTIDAGAGVVTLAPR